MASSRLGTAALALAASLMVACSTGGPSLPAAFIAPEHPSGWQPRQIDFAARDMVAAANPLAVAAGVEVLAAGGSAVDAAIAVQLVLTLVEPQSSGIGGGAFMLHYDAAAHRLVSYDGRETAPAAATAALFLNADGTPLPFRQAVVGGRSVGTPGVLRMLELAHRQHGRLPWAQLFAPAIELATAGFAVSPRLHALILANLASLAGEPAAAAYFLDPDGQPLATGSTLRNPALAATLRQIAERGADAFYRGPIADDIVAAVRNHPRNPGLLDGGDLAGYRARERPPVCFEYRLSYRICGMGMPSSGAVTMGMSLGMLAHFDLAALGPNGADAVHLMSEAYRLAYADRARYMADSDFVEVPVAGLLDPGYLARRAATIDMARSMGTPEAGLPPGASLARGIDYSQPLPSTSHVSIVDAGGNAVSMTTSIESAFGSFQLVRGFLLNNQLTDFSFRASDDAGRPVANRVEAGKRPRSSMSPTMVFKHSGELEAVLGSPGGSTIIQFVTRSLAGLIDWRLDIQQAIDQPHFGAQTSAITYLEKGTELEALKPELERRGHEVRIMELTSGLHGIVFNGSRADGSRGVFAHHPGRGQWAGGADPRREGSVAGTP